MTILHYFYNGVEYPTLPDPLNGASPMTDALFVQMGGEIRAAETLTDQEKFLVALDAYFDELETEVREKYAVNITKAEFKQAAATKLSDALIAWAKGKGVPDAMIDSVRDIILTKVADGSRLGLTWNEIFPKAV